MTNKDSENISRVASAMRNREPISTIPAKDIITQYYAIQNGSNYVMFGSLEKMVEEFSGAGAYYPYTLDGRVHDDGDSHEHFFEDLLQVVLENPHTFSIPEEMRGYYGKQQLDIIDRFQEVLAKARPITQADKAEQLARAAHWGQRDKAQDPYISHPAHVASMMDSDEATAVAWLHDTVEDTATTLDDLRAAGLSEEVVAGVEACTHQEGEDYLDYVSRAKENPLAREVKIEDILHNIDLSRLYSGDGYNITAKDLARVRDKYLPALAILLDIEDGW